LPSGNPIGERGVVGVVAEAVVVAAWLAGRWCVAAVDSCAAPGPAKAITTTTATTTRAIATADSARLRRRRREAISRRRRRLLGVMNGEVLIALLRLRPPLPPGGSSWRPRRD
jgi:hypothetical protein